MSSLPQSDTVLYEPFVDCFGRMCHENAATEIRFGEDIGQGGGVIDVKTGEEHLTLDSMTHNVDILNMHIEQYTTAIATAVLWHNMEAVGGLKRLAFISEYMKAWPMQRRIPQSSKILEVLLVRARQDAQRGRKDREHAHLVVSSTRNCASSTSPVYNL